jgi:hypothetical protein
MHTWFGIEPDIGVTAAGTAFPAIDVDDLQAANCGSSHRFELPLDARAGCLKRVALDGGGTAPGGADAPLLDFSTIGVGPLHGFSFELGDIGGFEVNSAKDGWQNSRRRENGHIGEGGPGAPDLPDLPPSFPLRGLRVSNRFL